jgi:DNA-binding transcriptional LysR family regulator
MDIRRLEIFCRVVELKSFTKAAEAVYLRQPTVSEHIRSLEDTLDEQLLDRMGKQILPTQAGKILYKYAKKIVLLRSEAIEALNQYSGKLAGKLNIGAGTIPGTYILPSFIGKLKSDYPAIQIILKINNSRHITREILNGNLDLGIVGARWNEKGLEWEEIFSDELNLIVYPEHPWASQKTINLDQIGSEPFILREKDSGTRKTMTRILAANGFNPDSLQVVAEVGSTEAVRQSIKAKLGISILSKQAVSEDIQNGRLKKVSIKAIRFKRPFYLVQHKSRKPSPICSTFLEYLT